jgi:hypothetical protein
MLHFKRYRNGSPGSQRKNFISRCSNRSTQEYHRYLESTYAMRSLHHCEESQVKDGMIIDLQTETAPNPSCLPLKDETKEFTDLECTWLDSSTAQSSVTHSHIQLEGTPPSPARAPCTRRSSRRRGAHHKRSYCEEEIYTRPAVSEQLYGKAEGVAISASMLPGAGRGLFGVKPSPTNPLLFKQANEFVCVYATMDDVISLEEEQESESAYV